MLEKASLPVESPSPFNTPSPKMDGPDTPPLSIGEQRVRTTFNPSNNSIVDLLKQKTAELINLAEELKSKDPRAASEAQTCYQTACMYAVYAATAQ
jgi:hypothetical protein